MRFKKFISIMLAILLINTTIASANTINKKETKKTKVEVEVMYNTKGYDFLENIVFDDGTKLADYDYTIKPVAMPRGFYPIADYFNYAAWITRDGVVSLSVDPKYDVRKSRTVRDEAWRVLSHTRQGFGSSPYWRNTTTMRWQFECHFWHAESKQYWNLEPHRYAASYAYVVLKGCNP